MRIRLPQEAAKILEILSSNKFEGYVVGGCVRDSLLGRSPRDWDICTSARPEEMLNIFSGLKVIPTGLTHGTVTLVIGGEHFEVTTYRIEEEYLDGRHPSKVEFTNSLEEDLKRRDFTINAMAYNEKEGLIDYYNGISDISNKIIRCVGNPLDRFDEDYLRMLRAVRFSTQLNYDLEAQTFNAIKTLSKNILKISKERIQEEVNKILLSNKPSKGMRLLRKAGLLKHIIPELHQHDKKGFDHIMRVLDNTEEDLILRLTALFYNPHMKEVDMTKAILRRLKYDNKTIKIVKTLVKEDMSKFYEITPRAIKELMNRVGKDNIDRLFKLQRADIKGSKAPHDFNNINKAKALCDKILEEKQPLTLKDLDINGQELIEHGIHPGKELGDLLNKLLDMVLDDPSLNEKSLLLKEIEKLHK